MPVTPLRWLTCSILAALGVLACNGDAPRPEVTTVSEPIHIGMLAPLTGNGARFGESQKDGVELAMERINSTGGVAGRKFELAVEDTKTEPPTAVTAFTRLSQRPDVVAIFGSAASLDVPAYLPQVDGAGIPHLLPVAVLPSITDAGSRWTFRNALNDRVAAQKMAEFVVEQLGAKRIGLLIEDSAFGETGLIFGQEAERLGTKPLAVERLKRGDQDVRAQLTKLKAAGVEYLQFWGYYAEYALVAKQMRELGFQAQLLGNQAPVNLKTIELGGDAIEGAMNVCLFVPASERPGAREFVDAFRAKYGEAPDTWAAQAYDGMGILADAVQRGGATREGIRSALADLKGYKGITGTISFGSNGDAGFEDTSIVVVNNGAYVPYRPAASIAPEAAGDPATPAGK